MTLTAERLREVLRYEPETGQFVRLVRVGTRSQVGDVAGGPNSGGYILVSVEARKYKAHRLAWLYMTGEWPAADIDHRNGVRSDNRWANLRDVSRSVNMQNRRRARSDNGTGVLGVTWHQRVGKFKATICLNGKNRHIGYFDDKVTAGDAYLAAKASLHRSAAP